MFGSPQDFEAWEQQHGAKGWGYAEMKKYANKAECRRLRPKLFKVMMKKTSCSIIFSVLFKAYDHYRTIIIVVVIIIIAPAHSYSRRSAAQRRPRCSRRVVAAAATAPPATVRAMTNTYDSPRTQCSATTRPSAPTRPPLPSPRLSSQRGRSLVCPHRRHS